MDWYVGIWRTELPWWGLQVEVHHGSHTNKDDRCGCITNWINENSGVGPSSYSFFSVSPFLSFPSLPMNGTVIPVSIHHFFSSVHPTKHSHTQYPAVTAIKKKIVSEQIHGEIYTECLRLSPGTIHHVTLDDTNFCLHNYLLWRSTLILYSDNNNWKFP